MGIRVDRALYDSPIVSNSGRENVLTITQYSELIASYQPIREEKGPGVANSTPHQHFEPLFIHIQFSFRSDCATIQPFSSSVFEFGP